MADLFSFSSTSPPAFSISSTMPLLSSIFSLMNSTVRLSTSPSERPWPSKPGTSSVSRSKPSRMACLRFCSMRTQGQDRRTRAPVPNPSVRWLVASRGAKARGFASVLTGCDMVLLLLLLSKTWLLVCAVGGLRRLVWRRHGESWCLTAESKCHEQVKPDYKSKDACCPYRCLDSAMTWVLPGRTKPSAHVQGMWFRSSSPICLVNEMDAREKPGASRGGRTWDLGLWMMGFGA